MLNNKKEIDSIFILAGIEVLKKWKLVNGYWPENSDYYNIIIQNPWWLVKTKYGLIRIGSRKRVVEINWEDTDIRKIVTTDDVTKELTMVHAWTHSKVVEYLQNLIKDEYRITDARIEKALKE